MKTYTISPKALGYLRTCSAAAVAVALLGLTACSTKGASGSADARASMGYPSGSMDASGAKDAFFGFDSSLLSSSAREALSKTAAFLKQNPSEQYMIEGHCDERGTDEYNLALGEQRAKAAYDYLRSLGVPSEQLKTISYGEERPFEEGSGEAVWSKNRRAHFAPK